MKQIHLSLLLAATMIGIALLAVFEYVPEEVAQFSPLMLVALLPFVRSRCACAAIGQESR